MALTIVTDIASKSFLNNPIPIRLTSDRNIDFSHLILAVSNNSGKVRLTVNSVSSSGKNLTVGDTIYLSGFTEADNLYLNGLYTNVIGISGAYYVDTEIDYVSHDTIPGPTYPTYLRNNRNFEVRLTLYFRFGLSGTYYQIAGPSSKSIDGTNFDFDVSQYLKTLYDENVGINETFSSISGTWALAALNIPRAYFQAIEYFDDYEGLQIQGSILPYSTEVYVHDALKCPNDIVSKTTIFVEGTHPNITGKILTNLTRGMSNYFTTFDVVCFIANMGVEFKLYTEGGVLWKTQTIALTQNKKNIILPAYPDIQVTAYILATIYNTSTSNRYGSQTIYLKGHGNPGYVVKFKNDLGGYDHIPMFRLARNIETERMTWEKKLASPYTTTDYGTKSNILRSDDILEFESSVETDNGEIISLLECQSVLIMDVDNFIYMHGTVLTEKIDISPENIENIKVKIQLNRRK